MMASIEVEAWKLDIQKDGISRRTAPGPDVFRF